MIPLLTCASWSREFTRDPDGGFRHRRHGFKIPQPPPLRGVDWRLQTVEGALIGFRSGVPGDRSFLTVMRECGKRAPSAQIAARNLLAARGDTQMQYSYPALFLGNAGWSQGFTFTNDDHSVELHTLTLVVGLCTFDWLLVTRADTPEVRKIFERWWSGFDPGLPPSTDDRLEGAPR